MWQAQWHMQNWIDCIRTPKKPVSDVEMAHRSVGVCHLANITRWVGRRLKWDPVAERFQDDDEANPYVESQDMLTPFFVSTPLCSPSRAVFSRDSIRAGVINHDKVGSTLSWKNSARQHTVANTLLQRPVRRNSELKLTDRGESHRCELANSLCDSGWTNLGRQLLAQIAFGVKDR